MARVIESRVVLHAPGTVREDRNGFSLFLNPERGNWRYQETHPSPLLNNYPVPHQEDNGMGPAEYWTP